MLALIGETTPRAPDDSAANDQSDGSTLTSSITSCRNSASVMHAIRNRIRAECGNLSNVLCELYGLHAKSVYEWMQCYKEEDAHSKSNAACSTRPHGAASR